MISSQWSSRLSLMRRPSGFSLGQKRRAIVSLMMITLELYSMISRSVKSLPIRNGMPIVLKKSLLTMRTSALGLADISGSGTPSNAIGILKVVRDSPLLRGSMLTTLADCTPGRAFIRLIACSKNSVLFVPCSSLLGYVFKGNSKRIVKRFRGSKPGSVVCKRRKLLIISPAPMSSASASAICATMNMLRKRAPRALESAPFPPSLSISLRSSFEACQAGARPEMIPASSETPSVKPSTQPSNGKASSSVKRGMLVGRSANGDLLLSGGGLSQTEIGDVGAGDQENEQNRSEQGEQRPVNISDHLLFKRHDIHAETVVQDRFLLLQLARNNFHILTRLFELHTSLEPRRYP